MTKNKSPFPRPEWDRADRALAEFCKKLKARSREEAMAQYIRLGYVDKHGQLTYLYGGEADPDESYEPIGGGELPTREQMKP